MGKNGEKRKKGASMTTLYYLGIIEGALHARGEDAYPVKVWHALKMLRDALDAPEIVGVKPHVRVAIARGVRKAKEVDPERAAKVFYG